MNMDSSNYCDRNAAGTAFIVLASITLIIASILVPLRIFVRVALVKSFWWDDASLLVAFVGPKNFYFQFENLAATAAFDLVMNADVSLQ